MRRRPLAIALALLGACVAGREAAADGTMGEPAPPIATIKPHGYTLEECLALADRNFPNLWAARARLAYTHAQLDEAKWTPFWNWSASSNLTVLSPLPGTSVYTSAAASAKNFTLAQNLQPWWTVDFSGTIPIYTFGKITAAREAAEAGVRVSEWDLEKWRQQARMDVRRAYFGAMAARDGKYIVKDVIDRLDKAVQGVAERIEKGDQGVEEVDKLRLEVYRSDIYARAGDPEKGERFAMASLRFYTGIQTSFDIPDEPLERPKQPIAPLVRYLAAARIFRPEVNMARAGIVARRAQADLARAAYFPDFGLGLGASYAIAPGATSQAGNIWVADPFNHFYAGAGIGVRWGLDLLPKSAKVAEAESQLEEARALERLALGGIAVEVENAYGVVVEADQREQACARGEHTAKHWIVVVQDAIDLGTKTDAALWEPLRAFLNERVTHVQALMDLNVAMSDLARVSGWDGAAPGSTPQ